MIQGTATNSLSSQWLCYNCQVIFQCFLILLEYTHLNVKSIISNHKIRCATLGLRICHGLLLKKNKLQTQFLDPRDCLIAIFSTWKWCGRQYWFECGPMWHDMYSYCTVNLLLAHGQRIVFIIFGIGIEFIVLCRKKRAAPITTTAIKQQSWNCGWGMFSDTCCLCYSEALTLVFDCSWKCDLPKLHLNVYHNLYCLLQIKNPISKHAGDKQLLSLQMGLRIVEIYGSSLLVPASRRSPKLQKGVRQ